MKGPDPQTTWEPLFARDETARECLRVLSRFLCRDGTCLCLDATPASALEVTGQVLLVVDRKQRVLYLSQAAREQLGVPDHAPLGMHWADLLNPGPGWDGDIEEKEAPARVMEVKGWNGVPRHMLWATRVLGADDGRIVGTIWTFQEIGHLPMAQVREHLARLPHVGTRGLGEVVEPQQATVWIDDRDRIAAFSQETERQFCLDGKRLHGHPLFEWIEGGYPAVSRVLEAVRKTGIHAEVPDVRIRRGTALEGVEPVTLRVFPAIDRQRRGYLLCLLERSTRGLEARYGIVSESAVMRQLVRRVTTLATQDVPVLIEGESGVGKELVARALHLAGPRAARPFHAVNCASLNEDLLENELFGHERGAFTGATSRKPGRMEVCGEGTLLLDEVGCLSPRIQAKLLRVLESREFERVGGTRTIPFRARLVAATNADLRRLVRQGEFREDLFYRLCVVPIRVPPLRERPEDILPLARHFLWQFGTRCPQGDASPPVLSPGAAAALRSFDWPGNVRQLRNAIQYALSLLEGAAVLPEHLPLEVVGAKGNVEAEDDGERARLEEVLRECQYRQREVARRLGVSRTTLWRMRKRLGLAVRESD